MTATEIVAAAFGMVCVALVVRRSMWNYAFGIASTALFCAVFFEARLYSDAALQVFFVIVNVYGWINWRRVQATAGEVVVERLDPATRIAWTVGWAVATLGWGWAMHHYTDASYPWPDAAIAIASVIAQILMARRAVENWAIWIAVDCASIPLYAAKGLWVTTVLYGVYLALAIAGFITWRRAAPSVGGLARVS